MKVLVIGGGIAGLTVCTSLRKFHKTVEIVLIEPKEYIEIHWCSYRSLFDSKTAEQSIFAIKNWAVAKAVKHIRATVTTLNETDATLSTGETIEFNACCICVGSQTRFPGLGKGPPSGKGKDPGSIQRRFQQLQVEGDKLLNSKKVIIVGGGIIGVETAGDLAYHAKQQNKTIDITLIHSQEKLIPEFTPKASAMTKKKLEQAGVKLLLNEKAIRPPRPAEGENNNANANNKITLQSSGEEMIADQIIWAIGIFPCNGSFIPAPYLDKKGWIQVDDYFRVIGNNGQVKNKWFALGDCCDLLPNQGLQILNTMNVIGKNMATVLKAIENNESMEDATLEKKMRKALVANEVYVATIGKQTGVAQIPKLGHTQFFLPWIKNITMFLYHPKQSLGLK